MLHQDVLHIRRREKVHERFAEATRSRVAGPNDGAGKLDSNTKRLRRFIDNPQRRIGGGIDFIDNAYIGFSAGDELDHVIVLAIQIA